MRRRPGAVPRRPAATYRLQLRSGVGFATGRRVLPYLQLLGVTDLYLSPPFAAEAGSAHGYDVVDPTRLDPALGGRRAFEALEREVGARGMGLVLDVVPNHMAASPANPWWRDLLRRGRGSPFARFFDIRWDAPGARGKLVLPVLDRPLNEVLAAGGFVVEDDGTTLWLVHDGLRLPLSPASERLVRARGPAWWNADRTSPERVRAYQDLLEAQAYRPRWWREGSRRLNYRRFFDISGLAGLREEDPRVFHRVHAAIVRMTRGGAVTGLRVDHVDGLLDPGGYLRRLRSASRVPFLVVEKILDRGERIPGSWPVDGATGYGLLNDLGDLFVDAEGWRMLGEVTGRLRGASLLPFDEVRLVARRRVLEELFESELDALGRALAGLSRAGGEAFSDGALRDALVEVTAALDVYRTYAGAEGLRPEDRRRVEEAARRARARVPADSHRELRFLRRVLLLDLPAKAPTRTRTAWLGFVRRWQQLTGPAAAKGGEDTAMYRDVRLLCRNEVGGDPGAEPVDVAGFHGRIRQLREGPRPLVSTSTHDTKRSEDVRTRIAVLSEMPERWEAHARRWMRANRRLRRRVDGRPVPDADEELYLYQTLLGAWPNDEDLDGFEGRIRGHVVKAAREAKVHTDWLHPDEAYEQALQDFAGAVIRDEGFRRTFLPMWRTVAFHGAMNALSQVVLRTALPGVADLYNGTETWDLSLVDPDNRRPVDFGGLRRRLRELDRRAACDLPALADELLTSWRDGRIKLHVVSRCLRLRREQPEVFVNGAYLPVPVVGPAATHAVSVARRAGERWVLAIAPRCTLRLAGAGRVPIGPVWGETSLRLARGAPRTWRDVFTGRTVTTAPGGRLALRGVLAGFPVAMLVPEG